VHEKHVSQGAKKTSTQQSPLTTKNISTKNSKLIGSSGELLLSAGANALSLTISKYFKLEPQTMDATI
jgi:hypothetical protein